MLTSAAVARTIPTAAARLALRGLARRGQHLDAEITLLTGKLDQLTLPTAA